MQTLSLLQLVLGGLSGVLVGFVLGLVGGGGSILAVPLMLYRGSADIRVKIAHKIGFHPLHQ
ncbi:hypothetical protein [Xanthomonas euvesicatoria]|uniref:hypothetical protein n=1 Tax=Xanthomonas euvesicatoria TaxID=456327 RepID=UPI00226B185F|nr:hypothetical protein [Xanthomonas euvesicatoria]